MLEKMVVSRIWQIWQSHISSLWASAVSSRKHVAEHCYPESMWLSIVILWACGLAVSSWEHVAEQCYPNRMWLSNVMKQNYNQAWTHASKVNILLFHVHDLGYKTFKIKFWKKWLEINKEDTLIIKNGNIFFTVTNKIIW